MASFFRFSWESPVRSLPRMDIVSVIVFNAMYSHWYTLCSSSCRLVPLFVRSGAVVLFIVWQFNLQLPMQSVHITTNVVSSRCTIKNSSIYIFFHSTPIIIIAASMYRSHFKKFAMHCSSMCAYQIVSCSQFMWRYWNHRMFVYYDRRTSM
jgi:hypothetical protein